MKSDKTKKSSTIRILAIHGFAGAPFDFAPLFESAELNIDWRFVSLPGHFREWKPNDEQDQWNVFGRRIDEIQREATNDNVVLVGMGYSMGARLLLRACLEHPEWQFAKLILIGVNPGIENSKLRDDRLRSDEKWANILIDKGMTAFLDAWEQQPIIATQRVIDDEFSRERRDNKLKLDAIALAQVMLDYSNGRLLPVWDALPKMKFRTELVSGESDVKFSDIHERMKSLIPDGRCHVVKNAGHAPHLENTTAFIQVLDQLLRS